MTATDNISITRVPVRTIDGTLFFHPDLIIRLEADNNNVLIYLEGQNEPVRCISRIGVFKDNKPERFFVCHRSHIINLNHVTSIEKDHVTIHLTGEHKVRMSEGYTNSFYEMMNVPKPRKK